MPTALALLVAYVLGVIAVARATRLVVHDPYPPVEAVRIWWVVKQANRDAGVDSPPGTLGAVRYGWGKLVTCPFCASPYITAVALAAAIWADVWQPDLGSLHGWWMILAVWASGSYLAAMVVLRDEPPAED